MKMRHSLTTLFVFFLSGIFSTAQSADAPPSAGDLPAAKMKYQTVQFESHGTTITGYLLKAADGATGAVLVPSCGGLKAPNGIMIRPFYRKMAEVLQKANITVLLVDGFTPRGESSICTKPKKFRENDDKVRAGDTIAAMNFLRSRKDINPDKLFLISYGATGGLNIMSKSSSYYDEVGKGFSAAVMFYPDCSEVKGDFNPYAPIQVFVGEKDDWNPPGECTELSKRRNPDSATFNLKIYPDTYHGFVMPAAPREVDGPPTKGRIIVGGNPASAADAYPATTVFLSGF